MVQDDSKKTPSLIAFFKLFLFDVKVEIMLISWHFFMALCMHPPLPPPHPHPLTATLIFLLMKGVEVVHKWTKFQLHGTCNSGVLIFWYFKRSLSSKKYHFSKLVLVRSTPRMGFSPLSPLPPLSPFSSKAKWFRMAAKKIRSSYPLSNWYKVVFKRRLC